MLLVGWAYAFELEEVATVTLPHAATRLVAVERPEGTRVVFVGPDAVDVLAPDTLVFANLARGANDAAAGPEELWLCADDGIWEVPWLEDTFGEAVQHSLEPCERIVAGDGELLTAGDTVVRWTTGYLLTFEQDYGAYPNPVLASDGTRMVAASLGGDTVLWTRNDTLTYPSEGAVGGLTILNRRAVWSVTDGAALRWGDGSSVTVGAEPGALTVGDFDLDGNREIAILHPESLGVQIEGAEVTLPITGWTDPIVTVPTASCPQIWSVDEAGFTARIVVVTDCGTDVDADLDGHTVADGDCDDADPETHPGGADGCSGIDRDCDGVVTWDAGAWLPASLAVLEGETVDVPLTEECFAEVEVAFGALDGAECSVEAWRGTRLSCTGLDDAAGTIAVEVSKDGTVLQAGELPLTVVNADPAIVLPSEFSSGAVSVSVGTPIRTTITAVDVDRDTVTFSSTEGPPTFFVSPDGAVNWTPTENDVGTFAAEIRAVDEDGGETVSVVLITTDDPSGCPCASSSAFLFLLVPAAFRRRRAHV